MVSVEDYRLLQKLRIKCGIITVMLGSQIHLPDICLDRTKLTLMHSTDILLVGNFLCQSCSLAVIEISLIFKIFS